VGRFVEHRPHHLVATPRYPTGSVDLAGLVPEGCQSEHRPDSLGVSESGGYVDGGAIGQRHHRADPRHRHQAPAHIISPDDGQQATMKNADLLAKRPPDNQQLSDSVYVGAVGYLYTQLSPDTGGPALLGDFRSRVAGAGPQAGWSFTAGPIAVDVNLRGYKEFAAQNRPEGWNVWLTVSLSAAKRGARE
jgi:hypothetical protein